jgi:hypothetical protein
MDLPKYDTLRPNVIKLDVVDNIRKDTHHAKVDDNQYDGVRLADRSNIMISFFYNLFGSMLCVNRSADFHFLYVNNASCVKVVPHGGRIVTTIEG